MTQLDQQTVKQTVNKLPLDLINRLLVDADKDCDLFSNNDADSPGRELSSNPEQLIQYLVDSPAKELNAKREKLIKYITNSDDIKTFNKAKALADSLAKYDNEIESIKQTEICTQINEHEKAGFDLNTVAGINTINQKFDRKWLTHETNIINQTGLNSNCKQAEAVTCQSEEVSYTKLPMPAEGKALPIAA